MKIITLTCWRRSEYLRRCLDALAKCEGIIEYIVLPIVDGDGSSEVVDMVKGISRLGYITHDEHVGINSVTRGVISSAFASKEIFRIIHLEEDVIVSPDALRYCEWALDKYESDKSVFSVGMFNLNNDPQDLDGFDSDGIEHTIIAESIARPQPRFSCWGWATWRDRWQEMEANWPTQGDQELSWDVAMDKLRGDRVEIVPEVSRSINIGKEGGTHNYDGSGDLKYWMQDRAVTNWQEVY